MCLVPYVLSCLKYIITYVLSCPLYLLPYVLSCSTCRVPYVLSCCTRLVFYVLSYPTCVVSYVLLCLICLVPYVLLFFKCLVFHVPRTLYGFVPHALWTLFPYVPYCFVPCVLCVLISPSVLLSFHASLFYFSVHLLFVIFWRKFTKVKTNIIYQYYFEVTISMIYLNYLKPNTKTFTYETADYFGTAEGESKARFNNHEKLFTL